MGTWRHQLRSALLRLLAGALLLSFSLALLQALVHLPLGGRRPPLHYGLGGFAAGLLIFALLLRAQRAYVFGHELTHWLAAKLFGRPTAGFRVGADRGSVCVARPNVWIVLAPYLVPLYALAWLAACLLLDLACPGAVAPGLRYAGLGLTYAFHAVHTVAALRAGQPDLRHYGPGRSLLLILTAHLGLIYGALALLAGEPAAALRALADAWRAQAHALAWLLTPPGA